MLERRNIFSIWPMSHRWAHKCQLCLVSSESSSTFYELCPSLPRTVAHYLSGDTACVFNLPAVHLSPGLWQRRSWCSEDRRYRVPLRRWLPPTHLINHPDLPCSLRFDGVALASSPLSTDTPVAPALPAPQMAAARGWLLPWKPHLMAFLSGLAPAWMQANSTLHNKELINQRHKASIQDCWLLMLMNAFNIAIPVVIIPGQPHY